MVHLHEFGEGNFISLADPVKGGPFSNHVVYAIFFFGGGSERERDREKKEKENK